MSQLQQWNFEDLNRRFRDETGARDAIRLLNQKSERELRFLLRHHDDDVIEDDETYLRDAFDDLLTFYGLIEIASLIEFVPQPLPSTFCSEALKHLRNPALRLYYEKHYPLALPKMAAARFSGERTLIEADRGKSSFSLFMQFLQLSDVIERDEDVDTFLWFLEDGYKDDFGIDDTLGALRDAGEYFERMLRLPDDRDSVDSSLQGFRKFTAFSAEFESLLTATADMPVLQSAFWHQHAYWFTLLRGQFGKQLRKALHNVAEWQLPSTGDEAEIGATEFERLLSQFDRLASDEFSSALLRSAFAGDKQTAVSPAALVPPANTWVEHVQQVGLRGLFTGGIRRQGPIESWEVEFGPGDRRWIPNQFLRFTTERDPATLTLPELLERGNFAGVDVLRRLMTHEKLRGTLSEVIYSMDAAQIDFYPYQFKPVLKFIESPSDRLILADEVGLGKTIEAALIWLELRARRQARRLLVMCHSRMLAEKWRKELREKFEIEASLADFGDLKTATERLEREGAFHTFCLIATYTGVKSSREDAHRLDSQDDEIVNELGAKATWLRRLRRWEQTHAPFDLVIFDEAQHMRNPDTAAFRLGESLALNAGAVLCVSATPLATSNEDLRTLLRLVDPSFFGNASVFNEMLEENRPAVRAGNALAGSRPNLAIAKTAVRELQRSRYLGGTALLKQAEEALQNLDLRDRRSLAEAQDIVERLNILGTYVTRTRRIQVEEMRAVRDPKIIRVEYSPQERALYDAILSFVRNRAAEGGRLFHFFEVIGWQLRAASCLPAVAARIQNTEDNDESIWVESFGDWAEPEENGSQKELPAPSGWNEFLKFDFAANDTKFAMLLKILNGELRNEKCVIFSYYRPTLAYLERRLSAENIGCLVIHGGVPQDERGPIVDKFASEAQVKVLLSSEVGSEGIDLQFCSVVVNYDLPWNPMRIEQRIGRIDRVGQKAERLRIFHFKIKDTVEERIFEKLHMRLELFRNSLGDLDAVLGEEIEKLTRELFSQKLTAKQEEYRIEQTALVIERRHREMEELESRGEGLVAMADYLQQKIRGSRGLGRYVTAEELEESLRDFFSRNTGAELRWDDPAPECFRIKLRPDMQSDLASFLGGDQSIAAQRLRAREFCVCFRSETVKSLAQHLRRQVLFINHLSPLIRWITKRNEQKSDLFQRVSAAKLLTDDYAVGLWIYLARRWSFNGGLSSHRMAYAAIGPSDQLVEGDSAETLVVRVLREGIEWEYPAYDQGAIFAKYLRCTSALDEEKGAASLKFAAENESYIQVRRQRTITYFERRIRSAEQAVATARDRSTAPHRIRGLETILRNERESRDSRLAEIERNADPSSEETDVAAGLICIESPS